ncbi:hypothetical protein Z945_698 [Sulfitobacter noctilucae]|nr:hypothetical protein Z945_698 [Sulfitobacter noctilucae]
MIAGLSLIAAPIDVVSEQRMAVGSQFQQIRELANVAS